MSSGLVQHPADYDLFGLSVRSDLRLAGALPGTYPGVPDLTIAITRSITSWPATDDSAPIYVSPNTTSAGESLLRVYGQGARLLLRFPEAGDFLLDGDRIEACPHPDTPAREIERLLIGTVLAVFLENMSMPVLHGSAVVIEDEAVGFLGTSRAGKSSVAAALVARGCAFLTDDLLVTQHDAASCWVRPGLPRLRLWPEVVEYFLGAYATLERVHPALSKRYVPTGPSAFGTHCPEPRPLRCLYVLDRGAHGDSAHGAAIMPLSHRDALIQLLGQSYVYRLAAALGWESRRLTSLAEIARSVPVRRLSCADRLERLSDVADAVLGDLEFAAPLDGARTGRNALSGRSA